MPGIERVTISISTREKVELVDITGQVRKAVTASGVRSGLCTVFVPHTTAGVTINENADPSVRGDMIMALDDIVKNGLNYRHLEGNSPAHVKSSLIGNVQQILVESSVPVLGQWQGVFFCEFDGPRTRKVHIQVQGDRE